MSETTTDTTLPDFGGQTIDLTVLNDAALAVLRAAVTAEVEKRALLVHAEEQAVAVATRYLLARDTPPTTPGAPADPDAPITYPAWVQPTGAHDAYPQHYRVEHDGRLWVSLLSGNVWEPGVSGWREFFPVPEDGSPQTYPEWVPPTGAHDAYSTGEMVTFEGEVYESLIDANTWSPAEYPAGWRLVEPEVVPDPEPEPEPEPEPGTPPAWVQPVDTESAYLAGDVVSYQGGVYESLVDDNMTVPTDPTAWLFVSGTPVEPEPEPAPTYPAWVRPTGGHDAYGVGDKVMFEGAAYESLIAGNTWSPTEYPAGWKQL